MPKFTFSKLVRDKIVDQQIASGAKPHFRTLSIAEHKRELLNKIIEETKEISQTGSEDIAVELADVQQAIDDLRDLYGLSRNDIAEAQQRKKKKHGAFKKGIYVEYVELRDDDPWTRYYRDHADRYPEIV